MTPVTIYVSLLDEGTDVWRPVTAVPEAAGVYRITAENPDPANERWQFATGTRVRCARRRLNGEEVLVAVDQVDPDP